MTEEDDWNFRHKPLEKGKMSIRKLRRAIKKAPGIHEVGLAIETFLCQFSKLELRWIRVEIEHKLEEKYNI